MRITGLPQDILYLILTEAALNSIDSLISLSSASRPIYDVYTANVNVILRKTLILTTGENLESALILAQLEDGLDIDEDSPINVEDPLSVPISLVKTALTIHRDLVTFSRFIRIAVVLKQLGAEEGELDGDWLGVTYMYALYGFLRSVHGVIAVAPPSSELERDYVYHLYRLLNSIKAEAAGLRPFARIDKKHLESVADTLPEWGLRARSWETAGKLLGVWKCGKMIQRWEKKIERGRGRSEREMHDILYRAKAEWSRWWAQNKESEDTLELLETWLEEHYAFKKK